MFEGKLNNSPLIVRDPQKALQAFEGNITELQEFEKNISIVDWDSLAIAAEMAAQVRLLERRVSEETKTLLDSPASYVKNVRTVSNPILEKLAEIEKSLKRKVSDYLTTDDPVSVDSGTISFRRAWAWDVEDESLIPEAYMETVRRPNAKEIKQAIKDGIRKIPGLKITNERTTVLRGKND